MIRQRHRLQMCIAAEDGDLGRAPGALWNGLNMPASVRVDLQGHTPQMREYFLVNFAVAAKPSPGERQR